MKSRRTVSHSRVYWNLQDIAESDIRSGMVLLKGIMEHFDLTELESVTVGRTLKQVQRQAADGAHYKLCGLHDYGNSDQFHHRPKECRIYINLDGKEGHGNYCTAIEVTQVPVPVSSLIPPLSDVPRIGRPNYGSKFRDKNGVMRIRWTRDRVIHSAAEGLLWVGLHEFYHFLRFTRQIRGIDSDLYADQFAEVIFEYVRHIGWWNVSFSLKAVSQGAITLAQERLKNLRREWPLPIPKRL